MSYARGRVGRRVISLSMAWVQCAGCGSTEVEPTELPPECRSEAWVEAAAKAYCRRGQMCNPDSELYAAVDACVEQEQRLVAYAIANEGVYTGGDPEMGHGACAPFINCDYPLELVDYCPRTSHELVHRLCLD